MHLSSINFSALRRLRLNEDRISENPELKKNLVMGKINIFIGANGGGKSTIIDLIRSIKDPILLPTLPRENMQRHTLSNFYLQFDDESQIIGDIVNFGINKFIIHLKFDFKQKTKYEYRVCFFNESIQNKNEEIENIHKSIPVTVAYRNIHDEKGMKLSDIVKTINHEGLFMDGLLSSPLHYDQFHYNIPPGLDRSFIKNNPVSIFNEEHRTLSIWFNDDYAQSNIVKLNMLPSGWRAYSGLLTWLKTQSDGCICAIEEPEIHIHPKLLRKMISKIVKISEEKNLQLFITTHSSILMDLELWDSKNIELFEVNSFNVNRLTDPFRTLSLLGSRPGDINHANGIIWVEGPSDRIYILHWLDLLCKCELNKKFKENIHFSFQIYGGSILSHFSANCQDNKINIFKINKNSLVVIDKDMDFEMKEGEWMPINENHPKNCIRKTVCSIITDGYTIESFLPESFFDIYFDASDGKVIKKSGYSKVAIAEQYCKDYDSLDNCFGKVSGNEFIKFIYHEILKWNVDLPTF